ncbi:ATP-dependent DNA helicase PcrA [Desulfuromusa kysingii]|uniref:DNA 3'-5' helicase n=1 Tax=Desulfuromusa kysingii TaxID=37625 RepID=A0A1H4DWB4_9BACT|nr:UvrD-helicase domain-containing protein [Desulfuromusa kysingii]SEA77085.1 ATP-dependent DNA helicase PcrA [Desulfuromusa kysingii]
MPDLLRDLNEPQRQAVLHEDGPLLLLAGAGSGKTRALTHRVAYLICERGVPAWQIMAVTFTNKAATEMRERLETLLGEGELPWISTFHSSCARILRQEIHHLGYGRDFSIYDDQDQLRLLRDLLKSRNISEKVLKPRAAASFIDRAKNQGLLPDSLDDIRADERLLAELYGQYQQQLKAANALDFGDLLLLTVQLFEEDQAVRERWQRRFSHLLIDEFQDTNRVQYRLMQLLLGPNTNLCVVGDDDQSIYRWRGAEIGNILDFDRDFSGARIIRLEQNYRSTQTILQAAGGVVGHNSDRREKELWTDNPSGDLIHIEASPDDLDEARFVAGEIVRLQDTGVPLRDIAVFYRTNAQSRALEEALRGSRVPYVMFGGVKFYSRQEVKDALSYIRILINPNDSLAARRIINVPARGIGNTTVERIAAFEVESGGFLSACRMALQRNALKGAAAKRVADFLTLIDDFTARLERLPYPQLMAELIDASGYGPILREEAEQALTNDGRQEARGRLENLEQLLAGMEEHASTGGSIQDYLEQIALITDLDKYDGTQQRVTLMTLHSAKGLEFPVVFMTGMEEGLFPHSRTGEMGEELAEERRLCYVGMTRAMEKLYLSYARRRRVYGTYQFNPPSRFLAEIPPQLVTDFVAEPAPLQASAGEHNLASLADLVAGSEMGADVAEKPVAPQPRAPRREAAAPESDGLQLGARVRHVKFGIGTVRRIEGSGDKQKVSVYFNSVGSKKLLLKFAGLMPV